MAVVAEDTSLLAVQDIHWAVVDTGVALYVREEALACHPEEETFEQALVAFPDILEEEVAVGRAHQKDQLDYDAAAAAEQGSEQVADPQMDLLEAAVVSVLAHTDPWQA